MKSGLPSLLAELAGKAGRWFLVLGLVGGSGCAVIERAELEEAKAQVSERAQQRWKLLMSGQMDQAYEYFSPASRSTVSREAFRRRSAGSQWWRSVKVEKVDCRPEACQVTMLLEYDLRELKGLKRPIEETWIRDSGGWWLVAGK